MEQKEIKYVALYLRKSRGDQESDLEKHRQVLTDLCNRNNLKYIEYKEIGSGENIEGRPVFQSLLNDVKNELFDAVCVVDIDRLGRGDEVEQARIKKIFANTDTYIITPQHIYNINDDTDSFIVDMHGFIARQEYKQILKRLIQGKKIGSKMGMWTNGIPPYPYEYQRWGNKFNERGLVVNDDKLKIYRYIVDSVINDKKTSMCIASELNTLGTPSPRNGMWNSGTILRLLVDETHLGRIISNKTVGDGHAKKKPNSNEFKKIPKDRWVIVENCHEPVKTIEEHEKIMSFVSRKRKTPKGGTKQIRPLSGLVRCGVCGHTMTFSFRPERKNPERIKTCWFRDAFGNKCPNEGMITNILYERISNDLLKYKDELVSKITELDTNPEIAIIKDKIEKLKKKKSLFEKTLLLAIEDYENGIFTVQEFKEIKDKYELEINQIKIEMEVLGEEKEQYSTESLKNSYNMIKNFETQIQGSSLSNELKNQLYRSVINCIVWTRQENNISIEIRFK